LISEFFLLLKIDGKGSFLVSVGLSKFSLIKDYLKIRELIINNIGGIFYSGFLDNNKDLVSVFNLVYFKEGFILGLFFISEYKRIKILLKVKRATPFKMKSSTIGIRDFVGRFKATCKRWKGHSCKRFKVGITIRVFIFILNTFLSYNKLTFCIINNYFIGRNL
jgi:hypothetical protein